MCTWMLLTRSQVTQNVYINSLAEQTDWVILYVSCFLCTECHDFAFCLAANVDYTVHVKKCQDHIEHMLLTMNFLNDFELSCVCWGPDVTCLLVIVCHTIKRNLRGVTNYMIRYLMSYARLAILWPNKCELSTRFRTLLKLIVMFWQFCT